MQQMDVFLQAETQSFVDMLFNVIESKEYANPQGGKEEVPSDDTEATKNDEVPTEPKVEADSTTPIREQDKFPDPRPSFEERRRFRSPPPDRRITSRLGPSRDIRDPPRRFRSRSRSRSLSPRHDRFRSSRRRSRSPNMGRRRSADLIPKRGRSSERDNATPTRDEVATGYTPTAKKPRCRDYDEKGFCLRGDLCKFDHGNDAVVLEDNAKPGVPPYQPGAPPGAPGTEPYVPGLPSVGATPGIPFPPPQSMSVPPPGYPPSYLGKRPHDGGGYAPPAKRFDFNRLGGRGRGRGRGRGGASSMLAVRNIPPELNTITHLNGHFARYGTLVNVQVRFEGDPASALVTFQGTNEAEAAFNTAEAVMNNRFIKVYWHMDKTKGNVKERLGMPGDNPLVLVHGDRVTKTLVNEKSPLKEGETSPSVESGDGGDKQKEEKEKAILAIQRNQEMLQTKADLVKTAEENRQKMVKQQETLMKSKQYLLDGLIEQQKQLIVKIEKGTMKAEEKSAAMKLP